MDDQHKHIEDWLKAAAQQPAPDDTGMEGKQQAWSKMASLLDNAVVPVPAQEPPPLPKPWFATGQGMLWLAAAAAAVGLVALVVYLQVNRHQAAKSKEQQGVVHENVSTVNELDDAQKNDPDGGTTVYGSTESDTMDEDNRETTLNGQAEEDINGDDDSGKGSYGLPAGAGSLVTQVVPQGNKLWSGVTVGAEKRAGEKGRDAAAVSGTGGTGSAIDEKASQGELSSINNSTQPVVKELDTALASNNLINKPTPSEKANINKTTLPVNQGINANNNKINNKPGGLPVADKNADLAANRPGGNTGNNPKHPRVIKDGKAKPGGVSGEGVAGKTKPGGIIKPTQPSDGVSGEGMAGKDKPGGITGAGKTKPGGIIKPTQSSGDVSGEGTAGKDKPGGITGAGKIKPGGIIKPTQPSGDVSGKETAGKTKPGRLVKAPETSQTPFAIKNATGTPNTMVLQPLRTVNAFSIHLPALPLNSREQQVSFIPGAFRDLISNSGPVTGGLALQAGFVYPLSVGVAAGDSGTSKPGNGWGVKLGASYAFPIARDLYLQPTLSASYLTGFGKAFSHTAVSRRQETDSSGAGTGKYRTDSTITPYTVKSTFVGGAGVNIAYVINKWIFSTGLTYQYALPSGTKGTPDTRTHTDSLQSIPAGSTPAFNKQQLPGMHTLSWSLDAGYYIRPRIQVGVSYRAILLRSAGNSGFAKPLQPLQDKQLELYIRVPLRK